MSRLLVVLSPLFVLISFAASDSSLQFSIQAVADRSSIPQARVLASNEARTFRCDTTPTGECWMHGVDPGQYQVEVSAPGFATRRLAVTVGHRQLRVFTVQLDVSPVVESIQVMAQQETESPRAATISNWRPEDLQALPFAETHDVPHAVLRLLPGTTRSHDDIIHVRGAEMSLNTIVNGMVGLESQHPSMAAPAAPEHFEAIELATGGFPAEYGLRLGGVVDATTRSGRTMKDHGSVALGGGGLGRRYAALELGGHTERWGFYLGSRVYRTNWFFSPPEIPALHDRGHGLQNLLQVDYKLDSKTDLRFSLLANCAQAEFPNTTEQQTNFFRDARQSLWNQRAQLGLNRSWNSSNLSVQLSQAWARSLYVQNDRVVAPYFSYPRYGANGSLRADYSFATPSRHLAKTGAEFFLLRPREELLGNEVMMLGMPNQHIHRQWMRATGRGHIAGYYLQDHVRLSSRWTLDLGLRFDHSQMDAGGYQSLIVIMRMGMVNTKLARSPFDWTKAENAVSPRVGTAYHFGSGTTLRASYSRLFLPPPVENQLLSAQNFIGMLVMGVPIDWRSRPLLGARGNQFDAGLTQKVGPGVLNLNLYDRRLENAYHTMQFGASRILPFVNFDREGAYGAEASLRLPSLWIPSVSGYLNYSAARIFYNNPIIGGFQGHSHGEGLTRFPAPMDQIHTSTGGLTWRHRRTGLWSSMLTEFSTGTPLLPGGAGHDHGLLEAATADPKLESVDGRLPSHLTADWSLGLDLLRETKYPVSLQFSVENVSNSPYRIAQESSFTPAQYSIGRVFSAGLRWHF